MKKFTLGLSVLAASISSVAMADEPSITIFEDQYFYGGFMPQCISENGKYVCGSSYSQVGFISAWQEGRTKIYNGQEGRGWASTFNYITNEGVGLSGSLINFETDEVKRGYGGYVDMMTEDGTIMVGMTPNKYLSEMGSPHYVEYQACYWENGKLHMLPVPTEEELGYYYLRTRARCISSDGSVILGEIVDRLYQLPMILWYRQEDGSYELDAVCKDYFSDIKYNEGYYKEYVKFCGMALSKNGKWVAMTVQESPDYGKPANNPVQIALYSVETGELRKAIITDEFNVAYNPHYWIYYNGVSNEGTIAGYFENNYGGESAFFMRSDDMIPRNFVDVFHTIGSFADYEEIYNAMNRVSSISPDGRYITGYGWNYDTNEGYVFDTGMTDAERYRSNESGITSVNVTNEGDTEYYNLSGVRVQEPVKGVTIVRNPDGTTSKIIK